MRQHASQHSKFIPLEYRLYYSLLNWVKTNPYKTRFKQLPNTITSVKETEKEQEVEVMV